GDGGGTRNQSTGRPESEDLADCWALAALDIIGQRSSVRAGMGDFVRIQAVVVPVAMTIVVMVFWLSHAKYQFLALSRGLDFKQGVELVWLFGCFRAQPGAVRLRDQNVFFHHVVGPHDPHGRA